MSTYKEHRRQHLLELEQKYGSLEALGRVVGVSASYLSQMKKVRDMGDKVARRMEVKLGMPIGALDLPPGANKETPPGGGKQKMTAPHFSPDARVQQLLNDYLDIPAGLREYVHRKVRDIKAYTEQMSQFQRNNFPEPPADPEGFASWERELEADVARARAEREPTRRRSKERAK